MSTVFSASTDNLPLVCYLPPSISYDFSIVTYIHMGTIAVLIWDVLNNLRNDYRMLFYYRFGFQTGLYIITRITLLAYALGRAVMLTKPVEDCSTMEITLNAFMAAFISAITLSFYLRIYAIYWDNLFVKVFYAVLWLGTTAVTILFTQSFSVEHLGSTGYCIDGLKRNWLAPGTAALLVYDVFIYLATTYRLYTLFRDSESTAQQRMKLVVFGASMPVFSKVILLDSQLYFLVIVTVKALLVITVYALDLPMNIAFVICILVLIQVLSSRIFRTIKMGTDHLEKISLTGFGTGMKFATEKNVSSVIDDASESTGASSNTRTITITRLDPQMNEIELIGTASGESFNVSERTEVKSTGFHDESAKEGTLYENHPWMV